jgi:hypothetical protein
MQCRVSGCPNAKLKQHFGNTNTARTWPMDERNVDQLLAELSQYTSTTQYFRMGPWQLISDDSKHLAHIHPNVLINQI